MDETGDRDTSFPRTKADLLAHIDRDWQQLQEAISGLTDEQMSQSIEGSWSIKDNLAHIAAWERFMRLAYLGKMSREAAFGIDAEELNKLDEDGINAVFQSRSKDLSVHDVLAMSKHVHLEVLDALNAIPYEQLLAPMPGDTRGRPLLVWITGNTYEHYREHLEMIQKLLKTG